MKRRTKQQGTLYVENGQWYLRYRTDRVVDGQLLRVRIAKPLAPKGGTTRRRARELADDVLADINKPQLKPETALSLADFVTAVYFPHIQRRLRPSTIHGYRTIWEQQLAPWCVDARKKPLWLRDTDTPEVQKILNDLAAADREALDDNPESDGNANEKKLGRNSLQHCKAFLSGVFRLAIQQKYYRRANPVHEASLPATRPPKETYAYSLQEIWQMLAVLPEPAATIIAVAAYLGLRRGEIRGALWEDYHDGELMVSRSVWRSFVTDPKRPKSKAPVPVIKQLAQRLEVHRLRSGNPTSGPIFRNQAGKPAEMNSVLNRVILPVLNRCGDCKKAKGAHNARTDHTYQRDASLPAWHGWHAFRRGLATNLHELGLDDETIQRILRHEDVSTTQACYIKTRDQRTHAAMDQFEAAVLLASSWPAKNHVQ